MPKRVIGIVALVVLLVAGLAYVLSSPHPQRAKQQQTEQSAKPSGPNTKHGESFWQRATEDPTAFFTLWIAIFTFVLAVSTIGLWTVTWLAGRRQVKDTKILQRAYVTVEPLGIVKLVEGKRVIGHVGIKNAGNLPAENVGWFIGFKKSGNAKETDFPLKDPQGKIVIAPKVTAPRGSGDSLAIKDLSAAAENKPRPDRAQEKALFLYVWGIVRYDDGFTKGRETKFCHRYNWKIREDDGAISERYARYHEYGNDAT